MRQVASGGCVQPEATPIVQCQALLHAIGVRRLGGDPCRAIDQRDLGDVRAITEHADVTSRRVLRLTAQAVAMRGDVTLQLCRVGLAETYYPVQQIYLSA